MYMLTKTCFILIPRFALRIKDFFFTVIRSLFISFMHIIFGDVFSPFLTLIVYMCTLFVTTDCVDWDDRTSYLEHYRDVIHVYFKFLCNETGCKVINMIYRYWFITNHDWCQLRRDRKDVYHNIVCVNLFLMSVLNELNQARSMIRFFFL